MLKIEKGTNIHMRRWIKD